MPIRRYFDKKHNRLVYLGSESNSSFWDEHWKADDFDKLIKGNTNSFFLKFTKKYLPPGSRILEGGCGRGDKVYSFKINGYNAYGVDYARETVEQINQAIPDLNISCQDVRNLNFENNFFDGYWSLGVIEHFYEGYNQIISEMQRVIKPGGYLFLTVPSMSLIRKAKTKIGLYPCISTDRPLNEFYQFALDENEVISNIESNGFTLIEKRRLDGIKGLKDEINIFKNILQKIYDSTSIIAKIMRYCLNLSNPFAGHVSFLIFQKSKDHDKFC